MTTQENSEPRFEGGAPVGNMPLADAREAKSDANVPDNVKSRAGEILNKRWACSAGEWGVPDWIETDLPRRFAEQVLARLAATSATAVPDGWAAHREMAINLLRSRLGDSRVRTAVLSEREVTSVIAALTAAPPAPVARAEEVEIPCGHCGGEGDIDNGDHNCMACGGTGRRFAVSHSVKPAAGGEAVLREAAERFMLAVKMLGERSPGTPSTYFDERQPSLEGIKRWRELNDAGVVLRAALAEKRP